MLTQNSAKKPHYYRIKASRGWALPNLAELWSYRDLFVLLTWREIQLRYKQTALGLTWVILQPLLTSAILAVIFGRLAGLPSDQAPYELFAFAGMLPWNLFSQSLQRSGGSLVRDLRLITKVFFPRMIVPIASSASALTDFFVSLVLMVMLLFLYKIPITVNILAVPFLLVISFAAAVGVGLLFSALSVYYRDFIYALPFLVQVWMYASPLAYSSSLIPPEWKFVYSLNPMVGLLDGFRWSLLGGTSFPWESVGLSIVITALFVFAGAMIFKRVERGFADVI